MEMWRAFFAIYASDVKLWFNGRVGGLMVGMTRKCRL